MGLAVKIVTAATVEPLTLAEAKTHLRVLHADEDDAIEALISEVREQLERDTRRTFAETVFEAYLDEFPPFTRCGSRSIELPRAPVTAVASVTYYDADGVLTTLDAADYLADLVSEPARIDPAPDLDWPATQIRRGAVIVRFTAGHSPTTCPKSAKAAMKLLLGSRFTAREAEVTGTIVSAMPKATAYESLIESLKVR